MQNLIHPSSQETQSGSTNEIIEPSFKPSSLVIQVSQISVNVLGSITFKAEQSPDGSTWFALPNLTTGAITTTGAVIVSLSTPVDALDHLRVTWTFSNANSVTFSATLLGGM